MFSYVQMKYFCCAYRCASMRKAAEELFVTRQALGKSLSSLETELGARLFTRTNDGLHPTAFADRFYPEAVRHCEESERLFESARAWARDERVRLRVGATFSAIETAFPSLPFDFASACPGYELELVERPDREIEDMVASGELECAFVIGPASRHPGVRSRCVHCEKMGMLVASSSPLSALDSLGASDLEGAPLLMVDGRFKATDQLLARLRSAGVDPHVAFTSGDFALLVAMCRMGKGLAPVPASRSSALATNGLAVIPLETNVDPGWRIDFIVREGSLSKGIAELDRYLRSLLP